MAGAQPTIAGGGSYPHRIHFVDEFYCWAEITFRVLHSYVSGVSIRRAFNRKNADFLLYYLAELPHASVLAHVA
jgi:hypothetical protein